MKGSMESTRLALVKAGRAERASSSRRAKVLALGAGVAVGAVVTTSSTAAAATAAGATASATATGSIPVSAAATGASFVGWKMVVVAAGLLAASGVAAVAVAVNERSAIPPRVESSRMVPPPGPTSTTTTIEKHAQEVPTMSVGDLPSAKDEAPHALRSTSTTTGTTGEPAPAAPPASLAEEMKSAESIRTATREGRTADALRLLDEHDARFPNGALSEETLVLRIEAFAKSARHAEAKALAEKFLSERPRSPYAPRVRSTMVRLD